MSKAKKVLDKLNSVNEAKKDMLAELDALFASEHGATTGDGIQTLLKGVDKDKAKQALSELSVKDLENFIYGEGDGDDKFKKDPVLKKVYSNYMELF